MLTAKIRNDHYHAELCSTHKNQDKLEPGAAEGTHGLLEQNRSRDPEKSIW